MGERMDNVQMIKQERDLRDECERIKQHLKRKEKDLLIAETRLTSEIKERKRAHDYILSLEKDLKQSAQELQELNTTLKVIVEQQHKEKTEFEERIVFNLKDITIPYIERLKKRVPDGDCRLFLEMIETNINKVMRPIIHTKIPQRVDLSPSEIKIATLISEGKSTKEISALLIISARAIEYHRNNIRGKLGIKNRKVNLRKYLSSLQTIERGNEDASSLPQAAHQQRCAPLSSGERSRFRPFDQPY
jgi:DNA-binding CsgD family transcriptional regulator